MPLYNPPAVSGATLGANTFTGLQTLTAGESLSTAQTIDWNSDAYFGRRGAASIMLGQADAAAPVAQTLSFQSAVGAANVAGPTAAIQGPLSTGTGGAGPFAIATGFANLSTTFTATISNASPAVVTAATHGLVPGSVGQLTTTGTLPTGLSLATNYYVMAAGLALGAFQLSATPGGAAINTSTAGSGTHTFTTQTSQQNPASTVVTYGPSALTGSQTTPALSLTQTWNTSGNATGLDFNVTNIASGASSLLMNLRVNGASKVTVGNDASFGGFIGIGAAKFVITSGFLDAAYIGSCAGFSYALGNSAGAVMQLGGFATGSSGVYGFTGSAASQAVDTFITRGGSAAVIQCGNYDAAAPVAQTLRVQSVVAGTSNTSGVDWTHSASRGTGTGAGGQYVIKTAPAGSTGTAQNALAAGITVTAPAVNQQPSVLVGNQALGTTATDGFLYITTCAGTPTGTPTAKTGLIPMVFDTTTSQFWFYAGGGWKQPKTPAGAALVTWQ